MAGEHILVVDDSVAVQELVRATLEPNGFQVTVASNGVAAVGFPDLEGVDLVILDNAMAEMSGLDTTRLLRSDDSLHQLPILLLFHETEIPKNESLTLLGANGWLKKPFAPETLLKKVQTMLEEKQILERSREHLRQAADAMMKRLAETYIQQAVEQKTQIIIERALQLVVSQVDQRARKEVDERVTQLSAAKQEELVKMTVQEVARSMVEKLAERKISEAIDAVLRDETERAVRRVADSVLPNLARERVREAIEQVLPKEVQRRVQKEAENLVPEASQRVVTVIDAAAQKIVPKIARELTQEIVEREVANAIDTQLPKHVQAMVGQEIEGQMRLKLAPYVREAVETVTRRARKLMKVMIYTFLGGVALVVLLQLFAPGGILSPSRKAPPPQPTPAPIQNPFGKLFETFRSPANPNEK